ncbi:hypothetical protein [Hyunsoonleella pacifica]|uniref:Lipoprotein n=1 Tax=Hyunsoonleella pacifica TaxID=1080224 RepID=A0A4Q9FQH2_9FLAO|nr:hypothetical protein [Hyunsoonleella pacifica]TBN15509.1 hypothetical protein EYD46_10260 [Hyunsoonleella pacifica]GGD24660.1 hypothetical protein GCM10011368_28420 [Hyunsoonleella pacifica]
MKAFKLYSFLAIIILLSSCSSNDDNDNNNANSLAGFTTRDNCPELPIGPTSAYWEYAKGNPIPLNQLPVLQNPQAAFSYAHSNRNLPPLTLTPPQGYQAIDYINPNTNPFGVNMIRNDGAVVWRYVPISTYPVNFSDSNILDTEVNNVTSAFGFNGNYNVLCEATPIVFSENGITRIFRARMIEFNNTIALIWIAATYVESLFTVSVASSVSAGPSNEYASLVMDIFLPMSFQLYPSGSSPLSDRDNDGTPDIFDPEPDNPNVK